jgi:hypothetical protein
VVVDRVTCLARQPYARFIGLLAPNGTPGLSELSRPGKP